jgi:hypothetical protein
MINYSIVVLVNQVSESEREPDEQTKFKGPLASHLPELLKRYKEAPIKLIVINESSITNEINEAISDSDYKAIVTTRKTKGALASAALALDLINEIDPIVLIPSNAKINFNLSKFIYEMQNGGHEAGIVTLKSENPHMSFVRTLNNTIVEIAEKQIIGTEATAGIFYFKNRRALLEAIGWALVNQVTTSGNFYIAPALNYFLTQRLSIGRFKIEAEHYTRLEG